MKTRAWILAATVAGVGVIIAAGEACTVTSGGDDGGINPNNNDSGQEASADVGGDTAADVTQDTSDAGGDAPIVCEAPDGSGACEHCIAAQCCAENDACVNGPKDGDSGISGCEEIVLCVNDCVNPPADSGAEAGSPTTCAAECSQGHSQQAQQEFQQFGICVESNCLGDAGGC